MWNRADLKANAKKIGQLIRIFPVFQVMMNGQMMKY